jgi:hypothetical protein
MMQKLRLGRNTRVVRHTSTGTILPKLPKLAVKLADAGGGTSAHFNIEGD